MSEPYDPPADSQLFRKTSTSKPALLAADQDDPLPHPSSGSQPPDKQSQTVKDIQKGIDEAQNVMHENIQAIAQRGERLDHLQNKTDDLVISSQHFRSSATKVRRQMWFSNLKWTICLVIFGIIIVASIIGGALKATHPS